MAKAIPASRLILASASPRRRRLLAEAGYKFDVVEPPIAELRDGFTRLSPAGQAEALAYFKARSVADTHLEARVLAADTVVAVGGRVLGKPADRAEAAAMLASLSGRRQAVITGVALIGPGEFRLIASDVTYVTMRKMAAEEIESYIASGEWAGKAGAYAIQESADRFVTGVEGSLTNVVGLPMELLERMFRELREHPESHRVV